MEFRKLADFLWPIGATVLALLGMPLAIEQYPGFFKENRWPLPISLIVVIICWIIPFLLHKRVKIIFGWVKSLGWIGKVFAGMAVAAILVASTIGSVRLFRFHTSHLADVLHKSEMSPEPVRPSTGENLPVASNPNPKSEIDRHPPIPPVPLSSAFTVYFIHTENHGWKKLNSDFENERRSRVGFALWECTSSAHATPDDIGLVVQQCIVPVTEIAGQSYRGLGEVAGKGSTYKVTLAMNVPDGQTATADKFVVLSTADSRFLDKKKLEQMKLTLPKGTKISFLRGEKPSYGDAPFITRFEVKGRYQLNLIAEHPAKLPDLPQGYSPSDGDRGLESFGVLVKAEGKVYRDSLDKEFVPEDYRSWIEAFSAFFVDTLGN